MVMRTMRGVGARRVPGTWWYKVGTLGMALVLPGGLLLLLYLMTRSRTHAAAPVLDPYVEGLRRRDGPRSAWQPTPAAVPSSGDNGSRHSHRRPRHSVQCAAQLPPLCAVATVS